VRVGGDHPVALGALGRYGLVHGDLLSAVSPSAGRPGQSGGPRHVCGQPSRPPAAREGPAGGSGAVRRIEPARAAAVPAGSAAVRVDGDPGRLDRTPEREPAGEIAWRSSAASTSTGSSGARTTAVMPQPD